VSTKTNTSHDGRGEKGKGSNYTEEEIRWHLTGHKKHVEGGRLELTSKGGKKERGRV